MKWRRNPEREAAALNREAPGMIEVGEHLRRAWQEVFEKNPEHPQVKAAHYLQKSGARGLIPMMVKDQLLFAAVHDGQVELVTSKYLWIARWLIGEDPATLVPKLGPLAVLAEKDRP